MGLGEALLAMWMAFAPAQGALLKSPMAPAEAGSITITKALAYKNSTDGASDFAVATRPWATQGGLPTWCNVGLMDGQSWNSRDVGQVNQDAAMMFLLAHEVGHCTDSRPFKMSSDEKARREAYGDAFASCVLAKSGRKDDLKTIGQARQSDLGGRIGKRQRQAIEQAAKEPECQLGKGHEQDFVDAWTVATRVDALVFGAEGSSSTAPLMARAAKAAKDAEHPLASSSVEAIKPIAHTEPTVEAPTSMDHPLASSVDDAGKPKAEALKALTAATRPLASSVLEAVQPREAQALARH